MCIQELKLKCLQTAELVFKHLLPERDSPPRWWCDGGGVGRRPERHHARALAGDQQEASSCFRGHAT